MIEIIAYEMQYTKKELPTSNLTLFPFEEKYYSQYKQIYNECFYDMRKALEVEPYEFYSEFDQMKDKVDDIYLLIQEEYIVGSVACYKNEIDDLLVSKKFQNAGIGKELLIWAMNHIRTYSDEPISLHVAKWNQKALRLYEKHGFCISKVEKIR